MARRVNMSSTILCMLLILLVSNLQKFINNSFLKEKLSKNSDKFIEIQQNLKRNSLLLTTRKCKWLKHRILYYHNSTASFNVTSSAILTCGDIHPHPGPTVDVTNKSRSKGPAAKCAKCSGQCKEITNDSCVKIVMIWFMFAVQAVTLAYIKLLKSNYLVFEHVTIVLYLNFHSTK